MFQIWCLFVLRRSFYIIYIFPQKISRLFLGNHKNLGAKRYEEMYKFGCLHMKINLFFKYINMCFYKSMYTMIFKSSFNQKIYHLIFYALKLKIKTLFFFLIFNIFFLLKYPTDKKKKNFKLNLFNQGILFDKREFFASFF